MKLKALFSRKTRVMYAYVTKRDGTVIEVVWPTYEIVPYIKGDVPMVLRDAICQRLVEVMDNFINEDEKERVI